MGEKERERKRDTFYVPAFRDELTKKEGALTRALVLASTYQQQRPLKESEGRREGAMGPGAERTRRGRVCARLCVDRGVNKRYTNVSHLGVYPSSFRWPASLLRPASVTIASAVSLPRRELLRRFDDEARARSGSSAGSVCRASPSRGDGEREATASHEFQR